MQMWTYLSVATKRNRYLISNADAWEFTNARRQTIFSLDARRVHRHQTPNPIPPPFTELYCLIVGLYGRYFY